MSHVRKQKIFLLLPIVWWAFAAKISHATEARGPDIYFYPPPAELPDRTVASSPLMLNVAQATTLFPHVSEMAGVVLVIPWSNLCPQQDACDFSSVDEIIEYWRQRGKKVVLCISTSGPPFKVVDKGRAYFKNQTPTWVSDKKLTYTVNQNAIGRIGEETSATSQVPAYWNLGFEPEYAPLVKELGRRYDGTAAISFVRIATGAVGEDSPAPFGPHPEQAPGYDPHRWIQYCRLVVADYRAAFPHTRLEFDISFMPWVYTLGDDGLKREVDQFVVDLIAAKVFIAFDGWQNDALIWHHNANKSGFALNRLMFYLDEAKRAGLDIGLEAIGPMFVAKMQNISSLSDLVNELRPTRIVFFGVDAAALAYSREGSSAGTQSSETYRGATELGKTGPQTAKLIASMMH